MRCPRCAREFDGNFCPNCGLPVQPQMQQPYQQYPFKIPLQPPKKKMNGCIIAIIIAFGVFAFMVIVGGVLTALMNKASINMSTSSTSDNSLTSVKPTDKPTEYTVYDVSEMMTDLKSNALKAEKKYQDQYIEITGKLSNIDSDGKYIDLVPVDEEYALIGVQCYIKSDEQIDKVMEMTLGDTVVIKGKITSIGEIIGYSLDTIEIK